MGATLVVGLGNPLLTDDAVGPLVARLLEPILRGREGVEVREASVGGLHLVEEMLGFRRVILIDSMMTGRVPPGTVEALSLDDLPSRNLGCAHDATLVGALALGRELGMDLPDDIRIVGIEAANIEDFGERPTDEVALALPTVVDVVLHLLEATPCA